MAIVWLALITALVLTVASSVFLTLRGLEAFRALKQLGRSVGGELERIERASGQIERQLALAADGGAKVEASLKRLSSSRARLNVLTSALADVRAAMGRVMAVVPRK